MTIANPEASVVPIARLEWITVPARESAERKQQGYTLHSIQTVPIVDPITGSAQPYSVREVAIMYRPRL